MGAVIGGAGRRGGQTAVGPDEVLGRFDVGAQIRMVADRHVGDADGHAEPLGVVPGLRPVHVGVIGAVERRLHLGGRVHGHVRSREADVGIGVQDRQRAILARGRDAHQLGVRERQHPLEPDPRVGAHVGPLGGRQAGVAADDDVRRQRLRGQAQAQHAQQRESARVARARMRHRRIIGHHVEALIEHVSGQGWPELTSAAIGTWSGGRFMHFGTPVDDDRLAALLRPGQGIATLITADAYGAGEADALLGRALAESRARNLPLSGPSDTTSTPASVKVPRAFLDSPTRVCAAPRATRTMSAWRRSAASSVAGSTPSTC